MDSYSELSPIYSKQPCPNGGFMCTLRLPPNPAVKTIITVPFLNCLSIIKHLFINSLDLWSRVNRSAGLSTPKWTRRSKCARSLTRPVTYKADSRAKCNIDA